MSTITSSGLGSGLDIKALVTQLITAEGQPEALRLTTKEAKLQADLSAMGSLKSALSTFQTNVQGLKNASMFQARTATSSTTDLFTVAADSSAVAGSFSIKVAQLAQSAKMRSGNFSDTDLLGAGTLAINLGASSFKLTTDSTTTLAGVRDAINKASDNPGITASIIKVDSGSQLVLTSSKTGSVNAISIVATPVVPNAGNDLTRLATASLTSVQEAKDAIIYVDGKENEETGKVTRASNSFSDVIPGVTFTLNKADANTTGTLSVALDPTATTTKVQGFINAYNALARTMSSLSSYDAGTKKAGALFGDSTLRGVKNQISRALANPVDGVSGFSTLAEIGIKTDKSGALVLDSTKFNSVMASNPTTASQLFSSENGLAARFDKVLTSYLSSGGPLSSRVDGDNKKIADITDKQDRLNARMATLQTRYLQQFNAMDALVGQLQGTGTYLTQMLDNLPGFTDKSGK